MIDAYPSKAAAARAAGVTAEQLGRYVKGINHAPFDTIAKLCAPVGVSLDWVATGMGRRMIAHPQTQDHAVREILLGNLVAGFEEYKQGSGARLAPLVQARLIVLFFRLLSRRLAGQQADGDAVPVSGLTQPETPLDITADPDLADILALVVRQAG